MGADPLSGLQFRLADGTIDFERFHRFALSQQRLSDIYGEYLSKIVDAFDTDGFADEYVAYAGDELGDFVRRFTERIRELPPVGWPFSATANFAHIYHSLLMKSDSFEVKQLCFEQLWIQAYEHDQYRAQDLVEEVLMDKSLSEQLLGQFAAIILDSKAAIRRSLLENKAFPAVIRRALAMKNSET
jgi:hypothetical protein